MSTSAAEGNSPSPTTTTSPPGLSASRHPFAASKHGRKLLGLVAEGHALISRVRVAANLIPRVYHQKLPGKSADDPELSRVREVVRLEQDEESDFAPRVRPDLAAIDDTVRQCHLQRVREFYRLFVDVYRFGTYLARFLKALDEGKLDDQTVDEAFRDEQGVQYLCEAIHVWGSLLLLVDRLIPSPVRQWLLVAYFRYIRYLDRAVVDEDWKDVVFKDVYDFLAKTDYYPQDSAKIPHGYPESFFDRKPLPKRIISQAITVLRTRDIYRKSQCYPDVDHKSTQYGEQAALLFVCLFFAPDKLKYDPGTMKQIVGKFFADSWVLPVYLDECFNLIDWWDSYKAAKTALTNTTLANATQFLPAFSRKLYDLDFDMDSWLGDTSTTCVPFLIQNDLFMERLRDANVVLRWFILHAIPLAYEHEKRCEQLRRRVRIEVEQAEDDADHRPILDTMLVRLFVNTAALERRMEGAYRVALDESDRMSHKALTRARECVVEAHEYCQKTELAPLFQSWLVLMQARIAGLEQSTEVIKDASKIAVHLQDDAEKHADSKVKACLNEAKENMHQFLQVKRLRQEELVILQAIGYTGYAWEAFTTPQLRDAIKDMASDPRFLSQLWPTFTKLSSGIDAAVFRLSQVRETHGEELLRVASGYSEELKQIVSLNMRVISEVVWNRLENIGLCKEILEDGWENPPEHQREELKQLMQLLEEHAKLLSLLPLNTFGIIQVDPLLLFNDSFERELRLIVSNLFLDNIKKKQTDDMPVLVGLQTINKKVERIRSQLEFAQGILGLDGLGTFDRVLESFISTEFENFSRPYLERLVMDPMAGENVLEVFADALLLSTDHRSGTVYVKSQMRWYDPQTRKERIDAIELVDEVLEAVTPHGLAFIDHIIGGLLQVTMKRICHTIEAMPDQDKDFKHELENLHNGVKQVENVMANPSRYYSFAQKLPKNMTYLSDWFTILGQQHLMRILISQRLQKSLQEKSKETYQKLQEDNRVLVEATVADSLDAVNLTTNWAGLENVLDASRRFGFTEPQYQVYLICQPHERAPETLLMIVVAELAKVKLDEAAGLLVSSKPQEHVDCQLLVVGLACLLRQFPPTVCDTFIAYMSQCCRSFVEAAGLDAAQPPKQKPKRATSSSDAPGSSSLLEAKKICRFLAMLAEERPEARAVIDLQLPPMIQSELNVIKR